MAERKRTHRYVWLVTVGCIPVTGFTQRNKMVLWIANTGKKKYNMQKLTAYRIEDGQTPEELIMDDLLEDAEYV